MIERCDDGSSTVDGLTERFLAIWSRILQGQMHPNVIHAKAEPFSIKNQLDAHFARHSRLTHSA
jgi:hypothetical protein